MVIQQIYKSVKVRDSKGNFVKAQDGTLLDGTPKKYWEAWYIEPYKDSPAGFTFASHSNDPGFYSGNGLSTSLSGAPFDDLWGFYWVGKEDRKGAINSSGEEEIAGSASFVEYVTYDDLKARGWNYGNQGGEPDAGPKILSLKATDTAAMKATEEFLRNQDGYPGVARSLDVTWSPNVNKGHTQVKQDE